LFLEDTMFASTISRVCKLGLLSLALAVPVNAASAQGGDIGSFVIHNPSSVVVHYQVKWGSGPWTSFNVEPGQKRYHSHILDLDNRAPTPLVRFDYICGDPGVTYREYRMEFYQVFDPWNGLPYVFRHSSDGRMLDLYKNR
jgi:hypothetical protein